MDRFNHRRQNMGLLAIIRNAQAVRAQMAAPRESMTMSVTPISKVQRVIDPNAPLKAQVSVLSLLIKDPPENSRIITITPELAAHVLANLNDNNRRQRPAKIKAWSVVMSADEWKLTGDTIKFGRDGRLIDGQNRLASCVRADKAFRTYVAFGIDPATFSVIDAGTTRTGADTFQISGVPYATIQSGAVRWLMIFAASNGTPDRGQQYSNDQLWAHYKANIDEPTMSWAAKTAHAIKGIPPTALAAHLYLFLPKNRNATVRFVHDLQEYRSGGKKLIDELLERRRMNMGRLHENSVNAMIILAWRAYCAGQSVTKRTLTWTKDDAYPTL